MTQQSAADAPWRRRGLAVAAMVVEIPCTYFVQTHNSHQNDQQQRDPASSDLLRLIRPESYHYTVLSDTLQMILLQRLLADTDMADAGVQW